MELRKKFYSLGCTTLLVCGTSLLAVEVTGIAGSPSSTTTIDGKQLPPPPDTTFGGKIERTALKSTPYWPARVVPEYTSYHD